MTKRNDGTDEQLGEAVRRSVSRHADALETRPDEDDLFVRVRRRGARKQSVLAIAAVLLLAAGALGGYLVGNSGGDDDLAIVTPRDGSSTGNAVANGSSSSIVGGTLQHLFTREANGIAIRAYKTAGQIAGPQDSDFLIAEMSNEAAVSVGNLYVCGDAQLLISAGVAGVAEGSPFTWVIIRLQAATADATSVRVDFGTSHDEMQPVNATAVLAAPLAAQSFGALEGTVEALDSNGTVLTTLALDEVMQSPGCAGSVESPTPTTIPPPSGPPPADEDAARAGVAQAFADAFTGATAPDVKAAANQDSAALADTAEQARLRSLESGYTQEEYDGLTVSVSDVRFLDDTNAALHFSLTLASKGTILSNFIGYAVFEDGRWKVSRRTQCELWALGGTRCP